MAQESLHLPEVGDRLEVRGRHARAPLLVRRLGRGSWGSSRVLFVNWCGFAVSLLRVVGRVGDDTPPRAADP